MFYYHSSWLCCLSVPTLYVSMLHYTVLDCSVPFRFTPHLLYCAELLCNVLHYAILYHTVPYLNEEWGQSSWSPSIHLSVCQCVAHPSDFLSHCPSHYPSVRWSVLRRCCGCWTFGEYHLLHSNCCLREIIPNGKMHVMQCDVIWCDAIHFVAVSNIVVCCYVVCSIVLYSVV